MKRGKLLFGIWVEKHRRTINIMNYTIILLATIALLLSTDTALRCRSFDEFSQKAPLIFASLLLALNGLLFAYIGWSKEFRIYTECIVIPKTLGRRVIPFSEISKIELNTHQDEFIPEIEINLKDGTSLKYPKSSIQNWEEFYRVMIKEIGRRVRVVK